MSYYYVYVLESVQDPAVHYTGYSLDLGRRLKAHNEGKLPNTKAHRPWRIRTAHAFPEKGMALDFERYLKTGSGREFARRHL